ncbi:MAG: GDSL-type esterase/lipase family protein [Ignavibacteriaceae bacterium]|nr:GDSL-type esterase/lipase family protein [Ignavibacteriaceae bacterium]
MVENKNSFKPFLLVAIALVLVLFTQYIPEGTKIFFYETKEVDFFSDVRIDEEETLLIDEFPDNMTVSAGVMSFLNNPLSTSFVNTLAYFPPSEKIGGNTQMLKKFTEALTQSKTKKIRIAHFGDSVIEGDLISADLRKNLQSKYSGHGVGFVAINSMDIAFRTTTKLSYSDNWKFGAVFAQNPDKLPVGINGAVSYTNGGSWVQYEVTNLYGIKHFVNAKLYYQSDAGGQISISVNNGAEKSFTLKGSKKIEELDFNLTGRNKSLKINVPNGTKGNFYGVSFEENTGIYVDNFPLRGNSGIALRDIQESMLKDFSKYLDYDLIVLNFGLNMLDQDTKDLSWYIAAMNKNIATLKAAFPEAGILIIGVQDKGIKKGSKFVTDPAVIKVLDAQKKIAEQSNVPFWNLYEAMGGEGAMAKWVAENKASKDYTHLNTEGAREVANLISKALEDLKN